MRRSVSLLVIGATRPARVAIYDENFALIEQIESDKPMTESLYEIVKSFDEKYAIVRVLYARGPGSFTGLKLSFLFLKSFAIARDVEFLAADSFALSGDRPIKAHGKRYFIKKNGAISVEIFENPINESLLPPETLDLNIFSDQTAPNYLLNAA